MRGYCLSVGFRALHLFESDGYEHILDQETKMNVEIHAYLLNDPRQVHFSNFPVVYVLDFRVSDTGPGGG